MVTRDQAIQLLNEWVPNRNLQKHMFAVEACLRQYAEKLNQDVEVWSLTGLLHDADWEKHPDVHPAKVMEWLTEQGAPAEMIQAIASHGNNAEGQTRFTERASLLDHYLFACDELSGLVIAAALVRPDKLNGLTAESVIKKMKDKGFARGVNRDDITQAVEAINIPLAEHITNVITALQGINDVLELG